MSNLNFNTGQTVPNFVIVPVAPNGKVDLYNAGPGPTDLIADVFGYYLPGTPTTPGAMQPLTPTRLLDTRTGNGTTTGTPTRVPATGTITVKVTGRGGIPTTGVSAVIVNLTVTQPATYGFITAYGNGPVPTASNLNFDTNQTVPNLAVVPVATDGTIHLYNAGPGPPTSSPTSSATPSPEPPPFRGRCNPSPRPGSSTPEPVTAPPPAPPPGSPATAPSPSKSPAAAASRPPASAAVIVNLTVTQPATYGFITAYGNPPLPTASNLNFNTNQTIANLAIVPVTPDGTIHLYNAGPGPTDLIADTTGYILGTPPTPQGWARTDAPLPTNALNAYSPIADVTCPSDNYCAAVGFYTGPSGWTPLLDVFTNGGWSTIQVTTPTLPGATSPATNSVLNGVSCPSAGNCLIVGTVISDDPTEDVGFLVTLSGTVAATSLEPRPTAIPNTDGYGLSEVSCPTISWCGIAGSYNGAGTTYPLAATVINKQWVFSALAEPPGGGVDAPAFVSCPSIGFCVASSQYGTPGIWELANGLWALLAVPNPAFLSGSTPTISGLACASASFCEVVGSYYTPAGIGDALIFAVTASTVARQTAGSVPNPSNGPALSLTDVSCPAPGSCVAVGSVLYTLNSGATAPLVEILNAGVWSYQPVPTTQPSTASATTSLHSIACAQVGVCTVIGTFQSLPTISVISETLSNGSWTLDLRPHHRHCLTTAATSSPVARMDRSARRPVSAVPEHLRAAASACSSLERCKPRFLASD